MSDSELYSYIKEKFDIIPTTSQLFRKEQIDLIFDSINKAVKHNESSFSIQTKLTIKEEDIILYIFQIMGEKDWKCKSIISYGNYILYFDM